ncbi:MAG: hypothetical protein SVC26_06765 [Pseudomonadota bacterium]|nr:hypothetical protein [Pseudomonadota bacterium]
MKVIETMSLFKQQSTNHPVLNKPNIKRFGCILTLCIVVPSLVACGGGSGSASAEVGSPQDSDLDGIEDKYDAEPNNPDVSMVATAYLEGNLIQKLTYNAYRVITSMTFYDDGEVDEYIVLSYSPDFLNVVVSTDLNNDGSIDEIETFVLNTSGDVISETYQQAGSEVNDYNRIYSYFNSLLTEKKQDNQINGFYDEVYQYDYQLTATGSTQTEYLLDNDVLRRTAQNDLNSEGLPLLERFYEPGATTPYETNAYQYDSNGYETQHLIDDNGDGVYDKQFLFFYDEVYNQTEIWFDPENNGNFYIVRYDNKGKTFYDLAP